MKGSSSQPTMPAPTSVSTGEPNHIVMQKLRHQNEKLRDELKDLTKQLEQYIEKTRIQKQP